MCRACKLRAGGKAGALIDAISCDINQMLLNLGSPSAIPTRHRAYWPDLFRVTDHKDCHIDFCFTKQPSPWALQEVYEQFTRQWEHRRSMSMSTYHQNRIPYIQSVSECIDMQARSRACICVRDIIRRHFGTFSCKSSPGRRRWQQSLDMFIDTL
jgi:hypothetical protein